MRSEAICGAWVHPSLFKVEWHPDLTGAIFNHMDDPFPAARFFYWVVDRWADHAGNTYYTIVSEFGKDDVWHYLVRVSAQGDLYESESYGRNVPAFPEEVVPGNPSYAILYKDTGSPTALSTLDIRDSSVLLRGNPNGKGAETSRAAWALAAKEDYQNAFEKKRELEYVLENLGSRDVSDTTMDLIHLSHAVLRALDEQSLRESDNRLHAELLSRAIVASLAHKIVEDTTVDGLARRSPLDLMAGKQGSYEAARTTGGLPSIPVAYGRASVARGVGDPENVEHSQVGYAVHRDPRSGWAGVSEYSWTCPQLPRVPSPVTQRREATVWQTNLVGGRTDGVGIDVQGLACINGSHGVQRLALNGTTSRPQAKKKDPCATLKDRLDFVEAALFAYNHEVLIQSASKIQDPDEAFNQYYQDVSRLVRGMTGGGKPLKELMQAAYILNDPKDPTKNIHWIEGNVGGQWVTIVDPAGKVNVPNYYAVLRQFIADNNGNVSLGHDLFLASLKHEFVHLNDYRNGKYPGTPAVYSEMEWDAFDSSRQSTLDLLKKYGCK